MIGPSREEAAVHGAGYRPVPGVERGAGAGLVSCCRTSTNEHLQAYVRDLLAMYKKYPALSGNDTG